MGRQGVESLREGRPLNLNAVFLPKFLLIRIMKNEINENAFFYPVLLSKLVKKCVTCGRSPTTSLAYAVFEQPEELPQNSSHFLAVLQATSSVYRIRLTMPGMIIRNIGLKSLYSKCLSTFKPTNLTSSLFYF